MNIAIVIVSFNTKDLIQKCLLSIEKYEDLKKTQVIVVDNNSVDGSLDVIKKHFNWVKLIKNSSNLGFARANNQGIKLALQNSADYVFLMNSDAELLSMNSIEKLITVAEEKSDAGAVAPRLLNSDMSIQNSVFYAPTIIGAIKHYCLGQAGNYGNYFPTEDVCPVEAAVMAAMLIPKSVFDVIGYLDEGYHMYYEDLDYCRRIRRSGLNIYYVSKVQILHHLGRSGQGMKKEKEQWHRLIPSSIRYHGFVKHWILYVILWSGQKLRIWMGGK